MPNANQNPSVSVTSTVVVGLVLALPLFYLFAHFGEPGRGSAATIFVLAMAIAILDSKKLWKQIWFWGCVGGLLLIHCVLLAMIDWPVMDWDGPALGGIVLVDLLFCVGFIRLGDWLKAKVTGRHK